MYRWGDNFEPVTNPFCDGFKIHLSDSFKICGDFQKDVLLDSIQNETDELIVSNILLQPVRKPTQLWLSLSQDSA